MPQTTNIDVSALAAEVATLQDEAEDLWMMLAKVCQRAQVASEAFAALPIEDPDEWWALKRRSGLAGLQDTLRDFDHRVCMFMDDFDVLVDGRDR